jgi:hypothetical protein
MIRGFFVLDESDVPRHQIRFHPCRTAGIPRNRKLGCLVELIREPARQAGKTASRKIDSRGEPMRTLLLILGLIALPIGLLWIGQGTGIIAWPASSFMIRQIQWAGYGAMLAALGLVLIWQSKR